MAPTASPATRLIDDVTHPKAADRLIAYFRPVAQVDRHGYSGRYFEEWRDRSQPNSFTPSDLLAVTALSVQVPPKAAAAIFSDPQLTAMLAALPVDRALGDHDDAEVESLLSAMNDLNARLRTVHDVGATTASKLMAAKRPHLVPIWDTVVGQRLNPPNGGFWRLVHSSLRSPDLVDEQHTLSEFLVRLRAATLLRPGVPADLSLLRVIDIAIWMRHNPGADPASTAV